jgi:hypothetical protein
LLGKSGESAWIVAIGIGLIKDVQYAGVKLSGVNAEVMPGQVRGIVSMHTICLKL